MKSKVGLDNKMTAKTHKVGYARALVAAFIGVLTAVIFSGCAYYHGQGETANERARRHYRTSRINANQLVEDIDKVLMLDRPSALTEKRVP